MRSCFEGAVPALRGDQLRSGVFIDILLLRIVNAHQRFDGFDDPLAIPDTASKPD